MKDSQKAILFLIFFAPFVGEGLSTSTLVIEWLNPLVIILLVFLYGFGALITRELMIRWDKGSDGWLTLLLLGATYGIIEEGLYLMTFFNPSWGDIGILGVYGRYLGVNWVWTIQLIIFHMIYSITIPIVLTHIAFPEVKEESWLSRKAFILVIVIFIACGPIWMLFVIDTYNYIPGITEYFGFFILTIVLIIIAKRAPATLFEKKEADAPSFKYFFFLGAIWGVCFFIIAWILPALNVPPIIPILLMPLWTLFIIWRICVSSGNGYALNEDNLLGLIIGALVFLFFLLFVVDILGFIIFGSISIILFALIKKNIKN
ncbi:MAG: hypothetical protein ACFFDK_12010 [Promethearchaeota archaeon]